MKKYLIFFNILIINFAFCQINIDYTIESDMDRYRLKINVTNNSNEYYMIPLDMNGFKGYYESEYCGTFDDQNYPYKFFAPTVMLKKDNTDDYLFPNSSHGHMPEGEAAEKYIKVLEKIAKKELKEIDGWKKKHHFITEKETVKNYYITKNLLFLKPNEKYAYTVDLDLGDIRREIKSILYDYYYFESGKYNLALHLCITDDAYNWLTLKQKKKLKKYKFFIGTIKSNSILIEPVK